MPSPLPGRPTHSQLSTPFAATAPTTPSTTPAAMAPNRPSSCAPHLGNHFTKFCHGRSGCLAGLGDHACLPVPLLDLQPKAASKVAWFREIAATWPATVEALLYIAPLNWAPMPSRFPYSLCRQPESHGWSGASLCFPLLTPVPTLLTEAGCSAPCHVVWMVPDCLCLSATAYFHTVKHLHSSQKV